MKNPQYPVAGSLLDPTPLHAWPDTTALFYRVDEQNQQVAQ